VSEPEPPPETDVALCPVTPAIEAVVRRLRLRPGQEAFVASNAQSLLDWRAHRELRLWPRAICTAGAPVGLLLLRPDYPGPDDYFLLRLMIAAEHQGRGYGRAAVGLLAAHVRTLPGATALLVSYVPGSGGPAGFYARLGFVETGTVIDDERVARLALGPGAPAPDSARPNACPPGTSGSMERAPG